MDETSKTFHAMLTGTKVVNRFQNESSYILGGGFAGDPSKDFLNFFNTKIPVFEHDPCLAPGLLACHLRAGGLLTPWVAYYRWLRGLTDEQFNTLIEDLVSVVEACRIHTDATKLLTINEACNFLLWLPADLKKKVDRRLAAFVGFSWNCVCLDPELDVYETSRHLGYVWTAYHYDKKVGHPLMWDPYGYREMSKEESDKIIEADGAECTRMFQAVSGWADGFQQSNREQEGEPKVFKDVEGYTHINTYHYRIKLKHLSGDEFEMTVMFGEAGAGFEPAPDAVIARVKGAWYPLMPVEKGSRYALPFAGHYKGALTVLIRTTGQHIDVDL